MEHGVANSLGREDVPIALGLNVCFRPIADVTEQGTKHKLVRCHLMGDGKVYDEVTEVTAKDGEVILDGPDGVDLKMTPKAAAETGHELINGAMKATGQERMKYNPHRAK